MSVKEQLRLSDTDDRCVSARVSAGDWVGAFSKMDIGVFIKARCCREKNQNKMSIQFSKKLQKMFRYSQIEPTFRQDFIFFLRPCIQNTEHTPFLLSLASWASSLAEHRELC